MLFTFLVGLWFSRRASKSTEDFFVSGRSLPWWVVGTSMVATTFAVDTPLVVSGSVARGGIFSNWFWWTLGFSGMTSVFLFAKLWRRSGVLTDAELVELRYGGDSAAWLRGIKAIWFGVIQNVLIIAWVMAAMRKIAVTVLELDKDSVITLYEYAGGGALTIPSWVAIAFTLFAVAVIYTSAAGMWGVVTTDVVQFVLAISIAIVFAMIAWDAVEGLGGIQASFAKHELDWERKSSLIPDLGSSDGSQFLLFVGVIWWGQRNLDGGGYLAQRLFAAKDERHAVLGYLWFTIAHICLRPWPWIVVGLAGMAMLGKAGPGELVDDPEKYYPLLMKRLLPSGAFGLMAASFLAAFMSTIDTQLNWGASLLVNDIYRRFVNPNADDARLVQISRLAILLLAAMGAWASLEIESIDWAWKLAFSVTAGIGTVYAARWYWWRTNAWSELSAMIAAALCTYAFFCLDRTRTYLLALAGLEEYSGWQVEAGGVDWLNFPGSAAITTLIALVVWVTVTLLTRPAPGECLAHFYEKVRPGGFGWRAVAGEREGFEMDGPGWGALAGILAGCVACYGALFAVGWWITGETAQGWWAALAACLGAGALARQVGRANPRRVIALEERDSDIGGIRESS